MDAVMESYILIAVVFVTLLACSVHTWWRVVFRAVIMGQQHAADLEELPLLPPGSLGLPWVGESISFLAALRAGEHDRFLRERTARFGSQTFKTVIFNQKTVVVQGAAANRFIAAGENKGLLRNAWPPSMLAVVGKGAPVALHGAEHRRLRHILLSCLSPASLHKLVGRAHTLTEHHFATSYLWQHTHQLTLAPLLKFHTFRLACSLLANVTDEDVLARLEPHFNAWLAGMLDLPLDFPGTNYRRARLASNVLRREMGRIIDLKLDALRGAARGSRSTSAGAPNDVDDQDVLSLLLKSEDDSGSSLSRQDIQDVLLFLLFAGHDTTTATLTFALKFLEQNPDCLALVVQEQEQIASKKKPGERLNWADVQSMKYTWRVIQETMRLRTPVIASAKEATEDLVFDGYLIPKGWKVYISLGRTHTDENYFHKADMFDPSRFDPDLSKEGGGHFPPFSYVPFGVGPHSCPGNEFARMTICVYLHVLVRHFTWASLHSDEKVFISTFPTLVDGYPVTISKKKPLVFS